MSRFEESDDEFLERRAAQGDARLGRWRQLSSHEWARHWLPPAVPSGELRPALIVREGRWATAWTWDFCPPEGPAITPAGTRWFSDLVKAQEAADAYVRTTYGWEMR